ncbi:MAG: phnE [Frankiales bacterium]|nr:phnE [Frankiales bacterium]
MTELQARTAVAAPRLPVRPARPLPQRVARGALGLGGLVAFGGCVHLAHVDPVELWHGLPTLGSWAAQAFPPSTEGLGLLLQRAAETVAIAVVGTVAAVVLALPLCVLAARSTSPSALVRLPVRLFLSGLRGVDAFVFALLFVAAVGLGPFAGVLGIALHTWGSMGKLFAEQIETLPRGPLEAAEMTGARRWRTSVSTLLPDLLPGITGIGLYLLEFNIRASTVLGVVGAGGIGQELKNAVDLLAFPRLLTVLVVVLVMVTVVDQLSAALRKTLA